MAASRSAGAARVGGPPAARSRARHNRSSARPRSLCCHPAPPPPVWHITGGVRGVDLPGGIADGPLRRRPARARTTRWTALRLALAMIGRWPVDEHEQHHDTQGEQHNDPAARRTEEVVREHHGDAEAAMAPTRVAKAGAPPEARREEMSRTAGCEEATATRGLRGPSRTGGSRPAAAAHARRRCQRIAASGST